MTRRGTRGLVLLSLLALLSCSGGDLVLPNEGEPASIAPVRGDRQNGTVGQALPDSLVVRVNDRFGDPVPGAEVVWVADNGGAVDPTTSTTDGGGRAATLRTLGGTPGTYTTRVSVTGLAGDPLIFVTTGLAAKLLFVAQPGAIAVSGAPLDPQPVLQLSDPDGNVIAQSGVSVSAQISSGGGTLSGTTTALSDGSGRVAFADLVLDGSPGIRTLIFAADGYASAISAPIGLGVGAPASIEAAAGDDQSGTVGTAVPIAPSVLVKDAHGNPVAGVPVHFTVTDGGGAVTGEDQVTGSAGTATVTTWTLGTRVGQNTLEARIGTGGVSGNPVEFRATGQAGALSPAKSTVAAAPGKVGAGENSTITVTALDGFGNPLPGLAVALSASGSGTTLVQPPGPTNAQGVATGRFGSTAPGDHTVSATIGGTAVTATATVTVTSGPPVASASSASVGNGVSGVETVATIMLRDAANNPVSGAADRISASVSGANTATGSVTETGGGDYRFRYTPRATGTDHIRIQVSGTDLPGSPLTSTVSAGPSSAAHTSANLPSSAKIFGSPVTITVTVRDAQDNVVGRGGDVVAINIDQAGDLSVHDVGDGTYTATWAPSTLGDITARITLNGSPISGSPFTVHVTFF